MSTPGARARARAAFVLALIIASSSLTMGAAGAVVSDEGSAFKPTPMSQDLYGVPSTPREVSLTVGDGTKLVLEYWRPVKKESGPEPPRKVPVVVFHAYDAVGPRFLTPIGQSTGVGAIVAKTGLINPFVSSFLDALDYLVPRGYAMVYAYQRGTGRSSGCVDDWSEVTADDGSRIIEWAGTQKWSTGSVGMYGLSSGADSAWATALTNHPDRVKRTKYLKAIIPMAGFASGYDAVFMDGAPNPIRNIGDSVVANAFGIGPPTLPHQYVDRICGVNQLVDSTENSGDFTPYWHAREHRDGINHLRAATLLAHGFFDANVVTRSYLGLLDRWPEEVPLKMLLGPYGHNTPLRAESRRTDWLQMVTAWYDRWLKDLDTGVEGWPPVQVQDAKGQWREESNWLGRDRSAELALSATGSGLSRTATPVDAGVEALGGKTSTTETTYLQGLATGQRGMVSFTTTVTGSDLRIYGDPVLDVWLKISDPFAKVGVRLDVLNAQGQVQGFPYASTYGARSMRHLNEFIDGRFAQEKGMNPELNKAFHTTIRLNPTDMLVPNGWQLRLSFFSVTDANPRNAGGFPIPGETTWVEGSNAKITILHNDDFPTVLRFPMADEDAPLLNIG